MRNKIIMNSDKLYFINSDMIDLPRVLANIVIDYVGVQDKYGRPPFPKDGNDHYYSYTLERWVINKESPWRFDPLTEKWYDKYPSSSVNRINFEYRF